MPANFSEYISLRPFDVSPTAVYLDAIDYARIVLPEFQPRQGTPEDAILQAISYISSLNISAINRLPDRLMAGIVGMMGVELDEGTKTVVDIKFTCTSHDGTTIPQGTVVKYEYEFLGTRYFIYFETSAELIIASIGEENPLPFDVVEAQSFDVGVIIPIETGTYLSIDTPTTDVLSAQLDSIVTYGSSQETESEYLNRAVSFLGSLSTTFANSNQVNSFISSNYKSIISKSKVYDLTNPEGLLEIGEADEIGYVTVFVYGINDFATTEQKTDLLAEIQDKSVAGLEIGIQNVTIVEIEIEATITHSTDYETDVIEANVKSILTSYFSPKGYRFTDGIKVSEFYSIISGVAGVLHITDLSIVVTDNPSSGTVDGGNNITFVYKGSLPSIAASNIVLTMEGIDF